MEMKRMNQDLVSEIQSIREASELRESKHQDTIENLTQEILASKVNSSWHSKKSTIAIVIKHGFQEIHATLRSEIEHYKGK